MKSITSWNWSTWTWLGILLLFLIRLENINLPPLDVHGYRQAITLGTARNYIEWDSRIIPPRSLLCDSREGYMLGEFPIYNYTISLLWRIFGQENWVFRILTLVITSLGLWHFFLFARRLISESGAFAATMFFGVSVGFMYARKGMPDMFAVSLVLIGVNMAFDYLQKGGFWKLPVVAILLALGFLSKIPSIVLAGLLVWPVFFDNKIDFQKKVDITICGVISLAAMAAWYFVWIPWAGKQYGTTFFFEITLAQALFEIFDKQDYFTLEKFFPVALGGYLAYIFFVAGFVYTAIKRNIGLPVTFLASFALLFLFMLQVGGVFSVHEYYVIPFAPVMALIAGYGASQLIEKKWLLLIAILIVCAESIYKKRFDFFMDYYNSRFVQLEELADRYIPKNDRIMVAGNVFTLHSMMYMAHRKGWGEYDTNRVYNPEFIKGEATVGLRYIIADRLNVPDSLPFPMVYEGNEFRIFQIPVEQPPAMQ